MKGRLPGDEGKVREARSYEITEHSVRFRSHWGSFVEIDDKRYQQAWNGHGPFVTIGVFDTGVSPTPRARVVLEKEQAIALAHDILRRCAEDYS